MSGELVPEAKLLMADADRERVITRLHGAVGEGRLTLAEFEERMTGVLAARTFGDVEPYLEGLPSAPMSSAIAARTELSVRGSSLHRNGRWAVPSRLHIEASGSRVVLDFTEAVISTSVVELDLSLRGSSARLIVPPGASVDAGGMSLVGSAARNRRVPNTQGGGGVHIIVVGEARGSSVRARYPRAWRWPWERRR